MLFFAVLSVADSVRWIPYLAIAAALVLAATITFPERLAKLLARPSAIGLAALLALVGLFFNNGIGLGVGPMKDRLPSSAVAYAKDAGLGGALINSFSLGGYAIWTLWPETKVSVDGRNDTIYPPTFLERSLRAQRNPSVFRGLREELGATWVMASNLAAQEHFTFLFDDPEWALVHWSEEAVIYVSRKDHRELLEDEYTIMDPAAVDGSVWRVMKGARRQTDRERLASEIGRMLAGSPDSLRVNAAAAMFFHLSGAGFENKRNFFLRAVDRLDTDGKVSSSLRSRLGL